MSARLYSVSGQTEGIKKAFLEWTSIDLSKPSKLSIWLSKLPLNYLFHVGVMLTIKKVFIVLFLLCLWE